MNNRIKMLLISIICLIIGSFLYIFSRPNAYISKFIFRILNITVSHSFIPLGISFYVPDYLWACALCSGLFSIYPLKRDKGWIFGVVTFIYGTVWELMQLIDIVPGTADIIDIILYLAAAYTVVMINSNFEKRKL